MGAVRSTTPTFALSLCGALDRPSPPTCQPSQPARRERLTLNMVFLQPSSFFHPKVASVSIFFFFFNFFFFFFLLVSLSLDRDDTTCSSQCNFSLPWAFYKKIFFSAVGFLRNFLEQQKKKKRCVQSAPDFSLNFHGNCLVRGRCRYSRRSPCGYLWGSGLTHNFHGYLVRFL